MVLENSTYRQDNEMVRECVTVTVDAAQVLKYVRETYAPDDVFEKHDLAQWAEDNGYVLAEEE